MVEFAATTAPMSSGLTCAAAIACLAASGA